MANGRQHVRAHNNFVDCIAGRHMSEPVHHSRHMHAAIERAEFVAAKGRVVPGGRVLLIQACPAFRGCPVITKDKDQGILSLSRACQRLDDTPNGIECGRLEQRAFQELQKTVAQGLRGFVGWAAALQNAFSEEASR